MRRAFIVGVIALAGSSAAFVSAQRTTQPVMEVYKSPTCGCCSKWVEHVEAAGFATKVMDIDDASLDQLKTKRGVPGTARSCHTAFINGYVVEGHVPAPEIHRMLRERPAIAGIAVGGMPTGSPGMEVPGRAPQQYNVVTFDKQGAVRVFSVQNR